MSTNKLVDFICILVVILALTGAIFLLNGTSVGISSTVDEDSEAHSDDSNFTKNDLKSCWDFSSVTEINLDDINDGSKGSYSGTGAYYYDNTLVIASAGHYSLSGNLSGSVIVDADESEKVWILLNGVSITTEDESCIKVKSADKVFLMLAEGTENTLTAETASAETATAETTTEGYDSSREDSEVNDDENDSDLKGAIFSKQDLTINGTGSLTIVTNSGHGIKANDDMVITGGKISISAPEDGIHVKDSLRITNTALTCNAQDDALHADKMIYIASGSFDISGCYEGLESDTIEIADGEFNINCSDDALNAESLLTINGGKIYITNSLARDADGFDSNGSIIINGGEIFISLAGGGTNLAIDFGSENNGVFEINGGTIIGCGGSVMYEAPSDNSIQASISFSTSSTVSAGTELNLLDSSGQEILSWNVPNEFNLVTISSPSLKTGETYTLVAGDVSESITLESTVYSNVASNGFGGFGGFGGDKNFGDFDGKPSDDFNPGSAPEGFDPGQMPEDFDPNQMPEDFDPDQKPETNN